MSDISHSGCGCFERHMLPCVKSVPHFVWIIVSGLFYKLQQNGIVGNIYHIIKNMYLCYIGVTLQVKYDGYLTPPFPSNNGVRQCDNLSPTVFNIFYK